MDTKTRDASIDECIKVCEEYAKVCEVEDGETTLYGNIRADAARSIADELRFLKEKPLKVNLSENGRYKLVEESSFDYRRLREKYPHCKAFYSTYFDGSYYDRASTTYYDENKNQLEVQTHSWYG
jgi:(2Fe-2S) ferredoxin